jgi:hypothetical protein
VRRLNRSGRGRLGVRARGRDGEDGAWSSRTRARVRCGGREGPDRRAPPVSAIGRGGGSGRADGPGEERVGRARAEERRGRERRTAGWAGLQKKKKER